MSSRKKPAPNTARAAKSSINPMGNFNVRSDTTRNESKGTKPTCEPTSIKDVLLTALMHLCKKTIFYDVRLKVAIYLLSLFIVSLIGDFAPFPRTYFARSDNVFNVYFVKFGWFWTILVSSPFLYFTSNVLCCGDMKKVVRTHLPRLAIATFFWYFWTTLFSYIENAYGLCNIKGYSSKRGCLKAGHFWSGFDISGHVFILIYSSLVLIEEARPIVNWDSIKDHLRTEDHNRRNQESGGLNPLRNLDDSEMRTLQVSYKKYTPKIKLLFIAIAVLQILWDIMLVCTMLYFHKMVEKFTGGIIAVGTWFITYRAWYPSKILAPEIAGRGNFSYQQKYTSAPGLARRSSLLQNRTTVPSEKDVKFMGRPIYPQSQRREDLNMENSVPPPGQGKFDFQAPPPKF